MAAYEQLDRIFVAGEWREGAGETLTNICPWDESTIFEMACATADDLDEACRSASDAQREWAALPPSARAAKMLAIGDILESVHGIDDGINQPQFKHLRQRHHLFTNDILVLPLTHVYSEDGFVRIHHFQGIELWH